MATVWVRVVNTLVDISAITVNSCSIETAVARTLKAADVVDAGGVSVAVTSNCALVNIFAESSISLKSVIACTSIRTFSVETSGVVSTRRYWSRTFVNVGARESISSPSGVAGAIVTSNIVSASCVVGTGVGVCQVRAFVNI